MPVVNIPKLARNKYNCVIGMDGAKYVTQSQLQTKVNGGGGGGVNPNINTNSTQMSPQLKGMIDESTSYTKDLCYAYATYEAMSVRDSCYAYTYSKIGDSMSYLTVETLVKDIIDRMLSTYELVSAAYVTSACERVQQNCYTYTVTRIEAER